MYSLEDRVERLERKTISLEKQLEDVRAVIRELAKLAEIQKKIYEAELEGLEEMKAGYDC